MDDNTTNSNSGTPENEEQLRELAAALRSEFELHESGSTKDALKDLEELKEDFLKAIKHTVNHSQSEPLKAKVAMWGYDKLLEENKASKDALSELLKAVPHSEPSN